MSKFITRPAVAAVALAIGLTSAAQAGPFNIWSASNSPEVAKPSLEQVQYRRHYRHHYRHRHHDDDFPVGAAIAAGAIGLAAGAALASQDRYYYDDRYYGDRYYGSRYYDGRRGYCDNSRKPDHYPAPAGC